jgi:hypothetical protein
MKLQSCGVKVPYKFINEIYSADALPIKQNCRQLGDLFSVSPGYFSVESPQSGSKPAHPQPKYRAIDEQRQRDSRHFCSCTRLWCHSGTDNPIGSIHDRN